MNFDAYLSLSDAAEVAGVNPSTLEGWRRRGWIGPDPSCADEGGSAPLVRRHLTFRRSKGRAFAYRLGDVLDAARDTAANPRSPGREVRVLVLS